VVPENVSGAFIFWDDRDVEGVDVLRGGDGDIEEASAECLGKPLIFIFRVDNDNIGADHERADDLELRRVRFSAAGLRKDHLIRIFQRKSVEDNQRIVVPIHAIHNAPVRREVLGNEWEERGKRSRVHRRGHG
jgi:hypothetical protein